MKRKKVDIPGSRRFRLSYFLLVLAVLYLAVIAFKFPQLLEIASALSGDDSYVLRRVGADDEVATTASVGSVYKDTYHSKFENNKNIDTFYRKLEDNQKKSVQDDRFVSQPIRPYRYRYGRVTNDYLRERNRTSELSELERMADEAWTLGSKAWEELEGYDSGYISENAASEVKPESCPSWIAISGEDLVSVSQDNVTFLPCGLVAGSSIIVVGTPHRAHLEYVPQLAKFRNGNAMVMVSQFSVELQGLKSVDEEAPPKILHLNPWLQGDWSHRAVIEHNTCYRMQWGKLTDVMDHHQ